MRAGLYEAKLAERLRTVRTLRKISQTKLAEKARVSRAYLTQLENGQRANPSMTMIRTLADALGVPTSALID